MPLFMPLISKIFPVIVKSFIKSNTAKQMRFLTIIEKLNLIQMPEFANNKVNPSWFRVFWEHQKELQSLIICGMIHNFFTSTIKIHRS